MSYAGFRFDKDKKKTVSLKKISECLKNFLTRVVIVARVTDRLKMFFLTIIDNVRRADQISFLFKLFR